MQRRSLSLLSQLVGVLVVGIVLFAFSYNTKGSYGQSQPEDDCLVKEWSCLKTKDLLRNSKGCPIKLNSEEMMSRVINKTPISPPALLGKNNLYGSVNIEVVVDRNGKVKCARGLEGHPLALNTAIQALSKWVFKPFTVDDKKKAVLGVINIPYDFRRKG